MRAGGVLHSSDAVPAAAGVTCLLPAVTRRCYWTQVLFFLTYSCLRLQYKQFIIIRERSINLFIYLFIYKNEKKYVEIIEIFKIYI